MDLSELERLEAPAKITKLSEAIRIGARQIPDSFGWCGCAIGAAHYAITGNLFNPDEHGFQCGLYVVQWAKKYGFSPSIAVQAERKHPQKSREQIADWLEAKGY